MSAAFQWIADLFATLKAFIPTWIHVEWTEAAIAIKRGARVRVLEPGIYWYWPFWTSIKTAPRQRQTTKMHTELMTRDGARVSTGAMVRFRIEDARLALAETFELDVAVEDETTAVLCQLVTTRTADEIQANRQGFNTALTYRVRTALKGYGVTVERAQLTAFARGIVVIHAGLGPGAQTGN